MRLLLSCLLGCLFMFSACSTARRTEHFYTKTLKKEIEKSPVFAQSFTGFTLLDPETGRILCDVNGGHNFTPASTTKILTLATCVGVLGDSVPGMQIWENDSTIYFRGTGDPTFLHTKFRAWQQIADKLHNAPQKRMGWVQDDRMEALGPGWAWDDAPYAYSAERTTLPVFGNTERIFAVRSDSLSAEPGLIKVEKAAEGYLDYGILTGSPYIVYYGTKEKFAADYEEFLPIKNIASWDRIGNPTPILWELLEKGLQRNIYPAYITNIENSKNRNNFYSTPLDTVLRRMMYQSDNFIAEQMLIVCSGVKYDTLRQDKIIQWAKDTLFASPITNHQSPNPPRWVDGSGLSRYNLVSPHYLTNVLWKLWREQPHNRLLGLFPTAGAPETTLDWWKPIPATPWLFAKSGSMSGVQCISGYLHTRRGKTLIFSFMNNNFVGSGKPWRLEMRRILELVEAEKLAN